MLTVWRREHLFQHVYLDSGVHASVLNTLSSDDSLVFCSMSCTNAAVSDASELPVSRYALTVAQRHTMELKAGFGVSDWFIDLHVHYRKKL